MKLKKKRKRGEKHINNTRYLRCQHCICAKNSRTKRNRKEHASEISTRHRELNSIREIRCFKSERNNARKTQARLKYRDESTKTSSVFEFKFAIAKNNAQQASYFLKISTSRV